MKGYNFTLDVRQSLAFAREEAGLLRHEYVGTEHILLGLLRLGDSVAGVMIQNLGADLGKLRDDVLSLVKRGHDTFQQRPDLPYTSRAKKCLELAMSEALELNHSYVGTEHMLLGLLREGKGIAAQVLTDAGITLESAREEAVRVLGGDDRVLLEDFKAHGTVTPAAAEAIQRAVQSGKWRALTDPLRGILLDAYTRAEARGTDTATVADLLEAAIRSSPAVESAFTSRDIEIDALIADVRANQ